MKRTEIKARPLADKTIAALEPEDKLYRERDSNSLYLYVRPNGRKGWEMRYRKPDGKYSWLGLGVYPEVKAKGSAPKSTGSPRTSRARHDPTSAPKATRAESTGR